METKKKKDGRFYLKEKIAKLEAENSALKEAVNDPVNYKALSEQYYNIIKELEKKAKEDANDYDTEVKEHQALEKSYVRLKDELNKTIKEQAETINKLATEKDVAESQYKLYKSLSEKYWDAMGWLRRLWYVRTKM